MHVVHGVDVFGGSVGNSFTCEDGDIGFIGVYFLAEGGRDGFVVQEDFGLLDEFVGLATGAEVQF